MPKRAAAKKTGAKKMTKASFVRSQPRDMPAKEVVAKGKAANVSFDEGYVYKIRTLDNKAAGKSRGRKPSAAGNGQRGRPKSAVMQHLEHVRALRTVILHVGIDRAKEMMDQIVKDLSV